MEITITIKLNEGEFDKPKVDVKVEPEETRKDEPSRYARFFDESSPNWHTSSEYNKLFILSTMDYMNGLLRARGHVFLNEVYDALGIPRSSEGQVVGWIYNEENPVGDNYIDFGFGEDQRTALCSGKISGVLLDFNVDGIIVDHIWKEEL